MNRNQQQARQNYEFQIQIFQENQHKMIDLEEIVPKKEEYDKQWTYSQNPYKELNMRILATTCSRQWFFQANTDILEV